MRATAFFCGFASLFVGFWCCFRSAVGGDSFSTFSKVLKQWAVSRDSRRRQLPLPRRDNFRQTFLRHYEKEIRFRLQIISCFINFIAFWFGSRWVYLFFRLIKSTQAPNDIMSVNVDEICFFTLPPLIAPGDILGTWFMQCWGSTLTFLLWQNLILSEMFIGRDLRVLNKKAYCLKLWYISLWIF